MSGIGGYGTTLSGATSLPAPGGVVEIVNITLPEFTRTDIDVSSMEPGDYAMEFIGGMIDGGVVDIEVNYDKTQTAAVIGAIDSVNEAWTITFPDSATLVFDGYINKGVGGSAPMNDKISQVLSMKVSGLPVFTPTPA